MGDLIFVPSGDRRTSENVKHRLEVCIYRVALDMK